MPHHELKICGRCGNSTTARIAFARHLLECMLLNWVPQCGRCSMCKKPSRCDITRPPSKIKQAHRSKEFGPRHNTRKLGPSHDCNKVLAWFAKSPHYTTAGGLLLQCWRQQQPSGGRGLEIIQVYITYWCLREWGSDDEDWRRGLYMAIGNFVGIQSPTPKAQVKLA